MEFIKSHYLNNWACEIHIFKVFFITLDKYNFKWAVYLNNYQVPKK